MDASKSILKEEGHAGLFFAYDDNGEYIAADKAVSGAKYRCPICGCRMHVTTTRSGKHIFARNPKETHRNPFCITIEKKGIERSFKDLDPETFITSLCHTVSRRRKGSDGTDPTGKPGKRPGHGLTEDDSESKLVSFSSLKQIAESGIDYLDPDDKQGRHKVSEYVMTYKFGMAFFTDPAFELGARIVYARFFAHRDRDEALLFFLFDKSKSVKFRLLFTSRKEYRNQREKFGKYAESENGTVKFQKRFAEQNVLIACDDWSYVNKEDCSRYCFAKDEYCKSCCGLYQAVFTNPKQLYIIPADH